MSSSRHSNIYGVTEMAGVPPLTVERFDALMKGDDDGGARHVSGRWSASQSIKRPLSSVPPSPPHAKKVTVCTAEAPPSPPPPSPPPPPPPPPPSGPSHPSTEASPMTVQLYFGESNGKPSITIETNAQSLDVFYVGLGDAIAELTKKIPPHRHAAVFTSLVTEAHDVMLRLAGYKSDRVIEQRVLICGSAPPDRTTLIATSSM